MGDGLTRAWDGAGPVGSLWCCSTCSPGRAHMACPIFVPTESLDTCLRSMQRQKECDGKRVGYGNEPDARTLWKAGVL